MHQLGFRLALPSHQPAQMHQATRIRRYEVVHVSIEDRRELALAHRRRNLRKLDGEGAPETAAPSFGGMFDQFESLHETEQCVNRRGHIDFTACMAADMDGGATLEPGAEVGDADPIDEELAQLEHALAHVGLLDEVGVVATDHGGTRAGGADDHIVAVEDLAETFGELLCLGTFPGVEVWLSAAGLVLGVLRVKAEVLEQAHGCDSDLRIEAVDEARDEEAESHERVFVPRRLDVNARTRGRSSRSRYSWSSVCERAIDGDGGHAYRCAWEESMDHRFARSCFATTAAMGMLLIAGTAHAQAETHDGFYLRLALGGGGGKLERSGNLDAGNGVYSGDSSISGPMSVFELALGGTPAPGLVVFGGLVAYTHPEAKLEREDGSEVDLDGGLETGIMGAGVDYYIDDRGGFHFGGMLGLGYARAPTPEGSLFENMGGAGGALSLSIGYDWWVSEQWSIGVLGRALGGKLHGEATTAGVTGSEDDTLSAGSIAFTALYH